MTHTSCTIAMLTALLATGCRETPVCDLADRQGTYLVTFVEIGGSCGPIDASVVRLDDAPPDPSCVLEVPDRVTESECKLERTITCPSPELGPGFTITTTAVTEQQDDDGDLITGTLTMIVRDGSGDALCASTYEIDADRQ